MKTMKYALILIMISALLTSTGSALKLNASAPTIKGDKEIEFNNPKEKNTLNWTIVDDDLKKYELYLDNILVSSKDWDFKNSSQTEAITINYDIMLDIGNYTFILTVFDYSDLQSTFETFVTIVPKNTPAQGILSFNFEVFIFGILTMVIFIRLKSYGSK